jgi:riboflavin kinase/FMN adenylyltransferase
VRQQRLAAPGALGWPHPAVTIGNFDGVHRGHQALVGAAIAEARSASGTSVVLTFDPHPSRVLSPERAPLALMTLEQKAEVLEGLGLDRLLVLPFTPELARESPGAFARSLLAETLGARAVVVGANFRFGRNRAGDVALLRQLGAGLGFEVRAVAPVLEDGAPINSTRIREALARGAVESARVLLGRRFFVDGSVVPGVGRGRTLGIPTANLAVVNETIPGGGVYACWCRARDEPPAPPLPAVVNVGRRPTFGGTSVLVEAHLLDFDGDLYGRRLRVEFEARLREERRFEGPGPLVEQIRRDIEAARVLLLASAP